MVPVLSRNLYKILFIGHWEKTSRYFDRKSSIHYKFLLEEGGSANFWVNSMNQFIQKFEMWLQKNPNHN